MRDLVAVDLCAGPEFVDVILRIWDDGDAVLPLQHDASQRSKLATATSMGASWLITAEGRTSLGQHEPVQEGDAVVIATSGSTGNPKGAVLTHDAIEFAAFASAAAFGVASDVHWLACLPLCHVGGLSVITRALHTGAGLSVHPGFDAAAVQAAPAAGATHVSLVLTTLRRIDPTAWRRILLGGSTVPEEQAPNVTVTYGMTETFGGIVYDGMALNGVSLRIAPADGPSEDPSDGSGPIEVASPSLLRCYRDGTDPVDADGWFRTGDLGSIDPRDGVLTVHGRADDLIITGAEKVWPQLVEQALEARSEIREAAVMGREDPEWGERVCALVVPSDPTHPPSLDEVRTWVREQLPAPFAPKELELRTSLPRSSLGKLLRRNLSLGVERNER